MPYGNAKRGLGLLGSFSNDDVDGNENVKKVIGLLDRFILDADHPPRPTITDGSSYNSSESPYLYSDELSDELPFFHFFAKFIPDG